MRPSFAASNFVLDDAEQPFRASAGFRDIPRFEGELVRFSAISSRPSAVSVQAESRMGAPALSDSRQLPSSSMEWRGSAISGDSGAMSCAGRDGHQGPRARGGVADLRIRRMTFGLATGSRAT